MHRDAFYRNHVPEVLAKLSLPAAAASDTTWTVPLPYNTSTVLVETLMQQLSQHTMRLGVLLPVGDSVLRKPVFEQGWWAVSCHSSRVLTPSAATSKVL